MPVFICHSFTKLRFILVVLPNQSYTDAACHVQSTSFLSDTAEPLITTNAIKTDFHLDALSQARETSLISLILFVVKI